MREFGPPLPVWLFYSKIDFAKFTKDKSVLVWSFGILVIEQDEAFVIEITPLE